MMQKAFYDWQTSGGEGDVMCLRLMCLGGLMCLVRDWRGGG